MRISVDGSRIRKNKVAFSNLSGIVWTGPKTYPPNPFIKRAPSKIQVDTDDLNLALFFSGQPENVLVYI